MAPEHRTVGFAIVDRWDSDSDARTELQPPRFEEEFKGIGWAALIPVPDQAIESAREECWVPHPTLKQLAFLGRVPNQSQNPDDRWVDEVFLAQLPAQADRWPSLLDRQTPEAHPSGAQLASPPGIQIRRLTHTESAPYPGVQGPRHWLMASNCGNWIYTLRKDPQGTVRIVRVGVREDPQDGPQNGNWEWISHNKESITHPPAIDAATGRISYLIGKRLTILDTTTGQEIPVEWDTDTMDTMVGPVQFLGESREIFWNARPFGSPWLQIWTALLQ